MINFAQSTLTDCLKKIHIFMFFEWFTFNTTVNTSDISILQDEFEAIMNDIIDEMSLGLCFEVHRSCKMGTLFLGDTDPQ